MRVVLNDEPRIESWQNPFGDWLFEIGVRRIRLSSLERVRSDEMNALIEVQSGDRHIYQSRINILSASQQESIVRTLKRRDPFSAWEIVIHLCLLHALKSERTLQKPVLLDDIEPIDRLCYAVSPILLADTTTVLAGDGGVGKSYFALGLAATILGGRELIGGLTPQRMGPVLYLDYEDSAQELSYRWNQLKRAFGGDVPSGLYYQRMTQPLHVIRQELLRQVRHYEPELIVVDSFSMACGFEPEKADSAVRVFDTLRTLGRTALLITHVAKAEQGRKQPNPYGSIHIITQARSVLIQKRASDISAENEIVFTIANTKNNRAQIGTTLGFRLIFSNDAVELQRVHSSDPLLLDGMTLTEQIRVLLSQPKSISELEELTGASAASIRAILARMRAQKRAIKSGETWTLLQRS